MNRWRILPEPPQKIFTGLNKYDKLVTKLLYNRGISDMKNAESFFDAHQVSLHDWQDLPNIKTAAGIILDAVKAKEKIYIYGDYDVDGVCATTIVFDYLFRELKANVIPYIPDRFSEGYGLNDKALKSILADGAKLVITVDCGIRDAELVEKFSKEGLNFIITDHHALRKENNKIILPEKAKAIVHPDLPKSKYPFKHIAGAVVAWKLVWALSHTVGNANFSPEKYYDLAALATTCDVMPLLDENRTIVKKGGEKIINKGLLKLAESAGASTKNLNTYEFGFLLGPRLNAGGRIAHALDTLRLLTSTNDAHIIKHTQRLNNLNQIRQRFTAEIMQQALELAEKQALQKLIFIKGKDWPEGVIGLIAGKLCEKYNRPVLVTSHNQEGVKGSARSISSFDITEALAQNAYLLEKFGGHVQAAGFSLKASALEKLEKNLVELANKNISDNDLIKEILIDATLNETELDEKLLNVLNSFSPFGASNPEPLFLIQKQKVINYNFVGKDSSHIKINFKNFDAIGFGLAARYKEVASAEAIDIIGTPISSNWNINKVELKITDFKISDKK